MAERSRPAPRCSTWAAWAKPLNRADWVIDVMPYETRGLLGSDGDGPERFSADTWVQHDICDREPWPFADDQFDFVVCSHVLEDIRDPLWVCCGASRVAKAGYIEVPSRLEEQSRGVQGDWVGWGHHHWLIELEGDRFDFLFKPHIIHSREEFWFPRVVLGRTDRRAAGRAALVDRRLRRPGGPAVRAGRAGRRPGGLRVTRTCPSDRPRRAGFRERARAVAGRRRA